MSDPISRRSVLRVAGGVSGLGVFSATGAAAAGPSSYIVGISSAPAERAVRSRAESVYRELDFGDVGRAVAGRFSEAAVDALRTRVGVRYVEPDGEVLAHGQTLPWGIDRVDADVVHANGHTGNGADVAVLDTGIDSDHPDLQANIGTGYAVETCSGSDCTYEWDDDNDHGTHCAGIADALDNTEGVVGVSTEATLHAVKVLDSSGSGTWSGVAEGLQWVADQGYDVASMSFGASSGSSTVKDACQYAYDRGVLLVSSAGNEGPCSDCVGYPAAYSTVIAVSATESDDDLASWSSTGPEIELAAPGASIYSTIIDGYDYFSGTSMSCPHVSGAGGMLMANGYTHTEARSRLQDTAEDIGLSSNEQGHGLLDVEAAMASSGGDTDVAVSTDSPSSVGETSATLEGTLTDLGGASSADCYFEYRESGTSTWSSTSAQTLSSTGSYSEDVSGLSSGTDYEYRAVADASDGDSDTGGTVTFTTDSGSSTAPSIDSYTVTEAGSPNPHADITADWAVSDADADLDDVLVEVFDSSGSRVDYSRTNVSGGSASGTDEFKIKFADNETFDVQLTVTDAAGNSTSKTENVSS